MRVGVIADRASSKTAASPTSSSGVVLLGPEAPTAPGYVAVLLDGRTSLKEKIEAVEAQLVLAALERQRWNQSKAAVELGLSRPGLANKIKRYRLRERDLAGDTEPPQQR